MSDRRIIKQAMGEIGQQIGKLQGRLFALEAEAAAAKQQIQRLDTVYQNLREQLSGKSSVAPSTPTIQPEEAIEALRDRLPQLDPASQGVCLETLRILMEDGSFESIEARNKAAIARLEKHAWKQGAAIALVQQVVRCLRIV